MACDLCAVIAPTGPGGSLQQYLRPGQPRRVASNQHAAAVPTVGAFLRGYLLVAPLRHTTSLGLLPEEDLAGVERLARRVARLLEGVYGTPVLGFEYGLNQPGARRVEHAHLHLLPTDVGPAFRDDLDSRLHRTEIDRLTDLPTRSDRSYICLWQPNEPIAVYPVANDATPRIRLREVIARLDPRLDERFSDWEAHPCGDLIQQTIDALTDHASSARSAGA